MSPLLRGELFTSQTKYVRERTYIYLAYEPHEKCIGRTAYCINYKICEFKPSLSNRGKEY